MPMHTSLRDGAEKNVEYGEIAQLARAPALQAGGHRFEPVHLHHGMGS